METTVTNGSSLDESLPTPSSSSSEQAEGKVVIGSDDVDFFSISMDDEMLDTDVLKQKLASISKKRQELQQMEIELRAQIIARTEMTPKESSLTPESVDQDNAESKVNSQTEITEKENTSDVQIEEHVITSSMKQTRDKEESAHSLQQQLVAVPRRSKRRRGNVESATELQQQSVDHQKQDTQMRDSNEFANDPHQMSEDPQSQDKQTMDDENAADLQLSVNLQKQDTLAVSESPGVIVSTEKVDLTDTFTTDVVFSGREELIKWVRDTGKAVGTILVVMKSDFSEGRTHRIIFGCERGGKYQGAKRKKGTPQPVRKKETKKCGCPFALRGAKIQKDGRWMVKVVCGFHNHQTHQYGGHTYAGRLTPEEKATLVEMANSGVKPKEILNALKGRDVYNASTISTIYNARSKMKVARVCGTSQMQMMLEKLAEKEYVECHRSKEDGNIVSDLFWAHRESIQLAKCFPHLFLMDCSHRMNRFRMPLIEIVGVASTNKTFSFAFAYLEDEKEENFVWALECMKSTLDADALPSIFVTDDVALMDAIKKVFPDARNLLCRFHISKSIQSNCKKMFERKEAWKNFQSRWDDLVLSATVEEYSFCLSAIERDFSEYSGVLSYITDNWLSKYKECFVAAWTDFNIHYGNTTINRAEGAHAKFKRYLVSSQGDFDTWWSTINSLLSLQQKEINTSFEKSVNTMMSPYNAEIFRELRGIVSKAALDMVVGEATKADAVDPNSPDLCRCLIRHTHGLPCAHEIAQYKRESRAIPLSCVHPHWKKLSSLPTVTQPHYIDCKPEIQMFVKRFQEADEKIRLDLLKKLMEIAA